MKFLVFSIFLLSASVLVRNVCPELKVAGPAGLTNANEPMTFVLEITGSNVKGDLKYEWTVTNGDIIDGQGSRVLRMTSSIDGANVTATVIVRGLPTGCDGTASEIAGVVQISWCPTDEYGKIPVNQERGRLDSLFTELENDPNTVGYVLDYENSDGKLGLWKQRYKRLVKHAEFRKFDITRIIFLGCDGEGPHTKFFRGLAGLQSDFGNECRVIGLSEL